MIIMRNLTESVTVIVLNLLSYPLKFEIKMRILKMMSRISGMMALRSVIFKRSFKKSNGNRSHALNWKIKKVALLQSKWRIQIKCVTIWISYYWAEVNANGNTSQYRGVNNRALISAAVLCFEGKSHDYVLFCDHEQGDPNAEMDCCVQRQWNRLLIIRIWGIVKDPYQKQNLE